MSLLESQVPASPSAPGAPTPADTPTDKLLYALSAHRLPLSVVVRGTSSATMTNSATQAASNLRPADWLTIDPLLGKEAHEALVEAAPFMSHPDAGANLLPGVMDWPALTSYLGLMTRRAAVRGAIGVEGEGGLSHYLYTFLFEPLNILFDSLFPGLAGEVYWDVPFLGRAKPEMVLIWRRQADSTLSKLILLEFKTSLALPSEDLEGMLRDIHNSQLYVSAGGSTTTRSDAHLPRRNRLKACKILDQHAIVVRLATEPIQLRFLTSRHAPRSDAPGSQTMRYPLERRSGSDKQFPRPREHRHRSSNPAAVAGSRHDPQTGTRDGHNTSFGSIRGGTRQQLHGSSASAKTGRNAPPGTPRSWKDDSVMTSASDLPTPESSPPKSTDLPLLVIPDADVTRVSLDCEPLQLTPFGHESQENGSRPPNPRIPVGTVRGRGAVWTTREAQLLSPFTRHINSHCNIVAKEFMPLDGPGDDRGRVAAEVELQILNGPLAHLPGNCVPRLHGVWSTGGFIFMLQEDGGRELSRGERRTPAIRLAVRQAVDQVHAAGVLHRDLEWRHILYSSSPQGPRITVIDYDRAVKREDLPYSDEQRALCTEIEIDDLLRYV